ncbi:MAG: hypothetical protein ACKOEC_09265 [Acidimicrobiia bacterium]
MTIKATDDLNAMAEVDFACEPIVPGDRRVPHVELSLPASAASPDVAPDFTDRAKVLFGADGRSLVGHGTITSIDRGTLHGVVPGARFAIYRDRKNGMPLVYLGEAVVLMTAEQASKVMITRGHRWDRDRRRGRAATPVALRRSSSRAPFSRPRSR